MNEQIKTIKKKIQDGETPVLLKIAFYIAIVTAAAATSWAVMQKDVGANTAEIISTQAEQKAICDRLQECETFCAEQKVHNGWTKETLVRMEKKLDKL